MGRYRTAIMMIALVLAVAGVVVILARERRQPEMRAQLVATPAEDTSGYAHADSPRPLSFPADYGPHANYQTEWWYYTGNLDTADGRHFGYELTIFRRALVPPAERVQRASAWASDQAYMAHFGLTDVADKRYQAFERLDRGAVGLAGAQASPYKVWLENWSIEETGPNLYRLRAAQSDVAIDVQLRDVKGPVLEGDRGYSQKGPEPGNASYYYSQTRLETSGTVTVGNTRSDVTGQSWMDHEYSTSALAQDQVGWDWFAIQLDDGSEVMIYQMRKKDGSVDPFSSGMLIAPDGNTRALTRDDFQVSYGATWKSPRSGATYPAQWTVKIPSAGLTLNISPYLADQELNVSYAYWEGAVRVTGEQAGHPIKGSGYVELTGYAGSMRGQL